MHHGEDGHVVAEQLFVQQCTVAFDVAGFLQRAHAAQARWRGNAHPVRQLHIRDSTVILQFPEDLLIDGVEAGGAAGEAGDWRAEPPLALARTMESAQYYCVTVNVRSYYC